MPELTHHLLDVLLEEHRAGAMLFGSEEHARFIESAAEFMPALIAAARQTIPGPALVEIRIPGLVPRVTMNSRGHWAPKASRIKKEREIVGLALLVRAGTLRGKHHLVGRVVITRHSVRRDDSDNCVTSMKSVRDAVAQWLGVNDGSESVLWCVEQKKATRATQGTTIRIEQRVP